jgi:glycine betaine catabolism A
MKETGAVDRPAARREERRSLAGCFYRDPDIFRIEVDEVLAKSWFCVGRTDAVSSPRSFLAVDIVDQPIVLLRDRAGVLRAFHNVCRHRGSLLFDPGEGSLGGAVKCPYHAWTYGLDGRLMGTPHVAQGEVDRERLGLLPVRVAEWQGCAFVNLSGDAPSLESWLDAQPDRPRAFEKWNLGNLKVAHRTTHDVAANWKILVENYHECLHCPTVHPEFVALIPVYRTGAVDEGRPDYGVSLGAGTRALTASGQTSLPPLPELSEDEALSVYGAFIFPNSTVDIEGVFATVRTIIPRAADRSTVTFEYLFAPETVEQADFNPGDVIEFNELVIAQDTVVCERVQRGVASRAFESGVYPKKDSGPYAFDQFYGGFLGPERMAAMQALVRRR